MSTSPEHVNFLKKVKLNKIIINIWRSMILLFFLLFWELLAKLKIINTFLTSCPTEVFNTAYSLLLDGTLINHVGITIYEIVLSFFISYIISFLLASLMWSHYNFSKIIDPYLTVLNSLPKVSLGPLIIIWAGAGIKSIILMGILISVFVTTINIYSYFSTTDTKYIDLMKSFHAKKLDIFRKVIVPSNYSNLISTIKINLSMCYIGVIMGELLVSKNGLGYLITYGSSVFHIDLVITSVVILCILSYAMYILIEVLGKRLLRNK